MNNLKIGDGAIDIGLLLILNDVKSQKSSLDLKIKQWQTQLSYIKKIMPLQEILGNIDIYAVSRTNNFFKQQEEKLREEINSSKYLISAEYDQQYDSRKIIGKESGRAPIGEGKLYLYSKDIFVFVHELGHSLGLNHPTKDCHTFCINNSLFGASFLKPLYENCPHKETIMSYCQGEKPSKGNIISAVKSNSLTSKLPVFSEKEIEYLRKEYR